MRRAVNAVTAHRRYTPAQLQEMGDSHAPNSADRISQQQTGYHGWAPGSSDGEEETHHGLPSISQSSAQVYNEHARRRNNWESTMPVTARPLGTSHRYSYQNPDQSHFVDNGVGGAPTVTESSLLTTALLQSVRRNTQFSARSRIHLQNYLLDRERVGHENEDLERANHQERAHRQMMRDHEEQQQEELRLRWHTESHRQRHTDIPSTEPPGQKRWLDEAIKYLERLRFCESYQESLSSAAAGGFVRGEFFSHNYEDFILDTTTIEPPPESSWLRVGGVFSGSQHAAGGSSLPPYYVQSQSENTASTRGPPISRSMLRLTDRSSTTTATRIPRSTYASSLSTTSPTCPLEGDERWPVKVTIHSIDYSSMTLSGTMEAFNVPDKSSPTRESSITTFLEGEIIDFNTYTLETKSFNADPRVDGTYWRKLPPFKELTDDEMVRNLVSKRWLSEELGMKWILMRWKGKNQQSTQLLQPYINRSHLKEKCFVTPSDAQSSLTISGFYYISLRRADGHVEGLYYDPSSTPYQHLSLIPEKKTFPTYEFR